MWVIDEYAIIVRKWTWFSPISPPVNALSLAKITMNGDVFISKNDRIDRGASFCHVDKTRAGIHAIEVITDGYHRWQGTIPIFINRAKSNIIFILFKVWFDSHIDMVLKISSLDPRACTNKYFTEASVSWKFVDELMTGINAIRFNSIANQIISQFILDIAMSVLRIIVKIVIIRKGVIGSIKMWLELNHQIWVRSSNFAQRTS